MPEGDGRGPGRPDPREGAPEAWFDETRAPDDVPGRAVALALALTVAWMAGGVALAWLVYRAGPPQTGLPSASAAALAVPGAPGPRAAPLEGAGVLDPLEGEALRRRAEEDLQGYAWVDRERGIARIPIEEAMRALVLDPDLALEKEGPR